MNLVPNKVAFGRHESFQLRFGWLSKGFQAFEEDPDIFSKDEATVTLGVGKNMVGSIRQWLRATQMCEWTQKDGMQATELGRAIFSKDLGWDPYLEDEATIWLIHWLLCTNPEHATAWYWFFNRFHKPEFTNKEVSTALLDFAKESITAKFTSGTVKRDAAVLLRMYIQSRASGRMLTEEALDSPMSLLKLISYNSGTKTYQSKFIKRDKLPLGILAFAVSKVFEFRKISEVPIEQLMYSTDGLAAPGSVFRLSETDLLTKLEKIIRGYPDLFEIRDSGGIHQIYKMQDHDPIAFLKSHYEPIQHEEAA
jgi:hypothetical protein